MKTGYLEYDVLNCGTIKIGQQQRVVVKKFNNYSFRLSNVLCTCYATSVFPLLPGGGTGLILENKHPIVAMQFLNEWGDRQVVPYHLPHNSSMRVDGKILHCQVIHVC